MNLNLFHDSRRIFVSARLYIRPIRAVRAPNFLEIRHQHADVRKPSILDQVLTSPNVASLLVAHLLLYLAPTSRVIVHGGGPFGMMTETAGQMFVDVGPSLSDKLKEEAMGRLREDTTQQVHREVFYRRMRVLKIGQQSKVVYSIRPSVWGFFSFCPPRLARLPELFWHNKQRAPSYIMIILTMRRRERWALRDSDGKKRKDGGKREKNSPRRHGEIDDHLLGDSAWRIARFIESNSRPFLPQPPRRARLSISSLSTFSLYS